MFGSATQVPDWRTASQELTRMGFLHASLGQVPRCCERLDWCRFHPTDEDLSRYILEPDSASTRATAHAAVVARIGQRYRGHSRWRHLG
jgi:hypothetical protein